jgi:putative ABC transport system ATP-binding protein
VTATENIAAKRPIIALSDVHLTLTSRAGPVDILRGVSLDIPAGQSVAIVGPSGSGKTSLLMIMLALARGAEIGIVFQSFHLVPTMTALENVALPLEFAGRADAFEVASGLLDEVGLGARKAHFPAQLSGGEQQRVALARALAPRPKLILADEPTGNLDTATGSQVIDLLFGMQKRRGATLVLVTHDTNLAKLCERTIHMADGQLDLNAARAKGLALA